MAMPKNSAKRNEILRCAYRLFTESGYTKVFLRDIAIEAGISKSLLQHYFPKKNDVIQSILKEMLSISFEYVENLIPAEGELFLSLSVYTRLFWKVSQKTRNGIASISMSFPIGSCWKAGSISSIGGCAQ
jgi:AcrR family transcriptional regulator